MKTVELQKRNNLLVADTDVIQVLTNQTQDKFWIKIFDSETEIGLEMSRETIEFLYRKLKKITYFVKYHQSRKKTKIIQDMKEEVEDDIPNTKKKAVKSD